MGSEDLCFGTVEGLVPYMAWNIFGVEATRCLKTKNRHGALDDLQFTVIELEAAAYDVSLEERQRHRCVGGDAASR